MKIGIYSIYFPSRRVCRQGDPNSPYIFLLCGDPLGLGGGFRWVLRFPPLLTTGSSQISHNWHKCDKNIPNIRSLLQPLGACEKVASDLGLGGGFCRVLRFPPLLTTGWSQIRHNWHKFDEKQNSKFPVTVIRSSGNIKGITTCETEYKINQ